MRIMIVTVGSRGDVQPYVALGLGLKSAGHEVVVCAPDCFEGFIKANELQYGYMNSELIDLLRSDFGRELTENLTNIFKTIYAFFRFYKRLGPLQRRMIDDGGEVTKRFQPDVVIFHPKACGGPWYAEMVNGKAMMALPVGMMVPSSYVPCIGFPRWRFGWLNRFTYRFVLWMTMKGSRKHINGWRTAMNLPEKSRFKNIIYEENGQMLPVMHCYSALIGEAPDDWPEQSIATGYWFLERKNEFTHKALEDFITNADRPIVYVGFGSMLGKHAEKRAKAVIDGLLKSGVYGVVSKGWGGLVNESLPESIFEIDEVPHDWLFERVDIVVHHGGAGTTAAGLRAGKPTIICPFFGDQPYWGKRVWELGLGCYPIPQKKLTSDRLSQAINILLADERIKDNATDIGRKLKEENGVDQAVQFIEKHFHDN